MKLGLISMLMGTLALAQPVLDPPLKTQFQSVWMADDRVLVIPQEPMHPDAPATVIDKSGKRVKLPALPGQKGSAGALGPQNGRVHAAGGHPYGTCVQLVPPGDPARAPLQDMKMDLFRFDVKTWQWEKNPYATLRSPNYFIPHLLSKDYLLGIAPTADTFEQDGKFFPFAIFKNTQGKFELDHYQDAGLAEPAIDASGKWRYPFLSSLWLQANASWSRNHTVLSAGNGLFWVFQPNGAFHGLVKLYHGLDETMLRHGSVWNGAVLAAQPNQAGELVVSCLAEQAMLEGAARMSRNQERSDAEATGKSHDQNLDAICRSWPKVEWFKVNLGRRKVARMPAPSTIPVIVTDHAEYLKFNWVFWPNGGIRMIE